MLLIQDDPIVKSIIERGYPPWIKDDDGYDNDWEEEDGDVYYGNSTEAF